MAGVVFKTVTVGLQPSLLDSGSASKESLLEAFINLNDDARRASKVSARPFDRPQRVAGRSSAAPIRGICSVFCGLHDSLVGCSRPGWAMSHVEPVVSMLSWTCGRCGPSRVRSSWPCACRPCPSTSARTTASGPRSVPHRSRLCHRCSPCGPRCLSRVVTGYWS